MISDTVRHSLIYSNDLFAMQRAPKMLHHFLWRFFDLTPPQPHCDYFIAMYFNKNWKTVYIISSVLKLNDSAES